MLDDVLGDFLDTLGEREFDAPFMAILRRLGFYDIHFLHGAFEFGKDFIAKRQVEDIVMQYVFQSKAGNIGAPEWQRVRAQLDEARTNNIAHASFDTSLPRVVVLVTTGRLVGTAQGSSQEYTRYIKERDGEEFECWDRERIVEYMRDDPVVGLAGHGSPELMRALVQVNESTLNLRELEKLSRPWAQDGSFEVAAVSALIIASKLRRAGRLDLACFTALSLVRAAAYRTHVDLTLTPLLDESVRAFAAYGADLWASCSTDLLDPDNLLDVGEFASFVAYPVRCVRTLELLSLYALLLRQQDKSDPDLEEFIAQFAMSQPGASRPVSDNYAVSLIPIGLILRLQGSSLLTSWATRVVSWVADYYDAKAKGTGLAPIDSSETMEVDYLAGFALESVEVPHNRTSLVASAVLDLAALSEDGDLFDAAHNEFLAVDAYPEIVETEDNADQYLRDGATVMKSVNDAYQEAWQPDDGWKVAPHHHRAPDTYRIAADGNYWAQLATSAVLRDRWFLGAMRHFVADAPGNQHG